MRYATRVILAFFLASKVKFARSLTNMSLSARLGLMDNSFVVFKMVVVYEYLMFV